MLNEVEGAGLWRDEDVLEIESRILVSVCGVEAFVPRLPLIVLNPLDYRLSLLHRYA